MISNNMTESLQTEVMRDALFEKKYVDVIDGLRPDSTFCLNVTEEPFLSLYSDNPHEFMNTLRKAIIQIIAQKRGNSKYEIIESAFSNLVIKPVAQEVISMHDITSKHENTTVTFKCQIIAIDSPKHM